VRVSHSTNLKTACVASTAIAMSDSIAALKAHPLSAVRYVSIRTQCEAMEIRIPVADAASILRYIALLRIPK